MKQYRNFRGVYFIEKRRDILLLTKSLLKGHRVYGEDLIREGEDEFRAWNPERSKLGAALQKEVSQIGIKENDYVLYLGASTGTTVSHVSDIVGKEGLV